MKEIYNKIQDKLNIFWGTYQVGKSHTMLYVAKMLVDTGRKVLLIDATKTQSLFNYFSYNMNIEEQAALDKYTAFTRNEIDILANNPLIHNQGALKLQANINYESYDYILVEADETIDNQMIAHAKNLFVIQNSDYDKLKRNINMLNKFNLIDKNLILVLNQFMKCKLKKAYILDEYVKCLKLQMFDSNIIEIPYNAHNAIAAMNNKYDGILNLRGYDNSFKQNIFELVKLIAYIDNTLYRKII